MSARVHDDVSVWERESIDEACGVLFAMVKKLGLQSVTVEVSASGCVDIRGSDAKTGYHVFTDHADSLPGGPLPPPGSSIAKRMSEGR